MSDVELKGHPLALIFPRPSALAQAELGASIASRGQRELIVLLDGMILDGLTRYTECRRLGIPPKVRLYDPRDVADGGDGPSPIDFVEDRNLHRRDLTTGQRAWIASELEKHRHGGRRTPASDQDANLQLEGLGSERVGETRADLAERHGVSERSIADAAKVRDQGAPELKEALKQGEIVPDVAAVIAEKPKDEQVSLLASLPRGPDGKLTPEAKKEVRAVARELKDELNTIKKQRRSEREREQGAMQLAGPVQKYGVILADPEWRFEPYSRETGMDRAADNHYATTALPEIMARRALIDELAADDCVLGLWVTDIANGMKVAEAWGFVVKSFRVWVKDVVEYEFADSTRGALKLPPGKFLNVCGAPGPGFWGRSRAELMLICVRGQPACPPMGQQGENVWFAARPHIEGTNKDQHSAKPEETAHDFFDTHYPSFRKVELNARGARDGWHRWGLEAPRGEGWIGPLPVDEHKFAPADEAAEPDIGDEGDGTLPPFPWAAAEGGEAETDPAADAAAKSDNEAAEAAQEFPTGGQPASHGA